MFKRLKQNFEGGIERLKWFSSLLSERLKVELALVRLLYQSEQMERRRDDLLQTIGKRVHELKEHPEMQVFKDRTVAETLAEVEKINEEIDSMRKKASEISRFEGG